MPKCKTTMKLNHKSILFGFISLLLLVPGDGFGLTLGRTRGAVILGRPLDLSVQVQSTAEDEITVACFEANVSYGDTPLERTRVAIKLLPGPQPDTQLVRLTSDAAVDEPLVRITLRNVCNPKTSRSYTLLSDVVSDSPLPMPVPAGQAAAPLAHSAPDKASSSAAASTAKTGAGAAAESGAATGAEAKKKAPRSALKLVAPPAVPTATKADSKASAATTAALQDLQRRVDELAKWQSENTLLADIQKGEARTKALEADIRGLQAVTAKNQQNIKMVADALESSSSQSQVTTVAYALGAVLLACLAALVFVASRKRSGAPAPWWSGQDERARAPGAAARNSSAAALERAASLPASLHAAPPTPQPDAARSARDQTITAMQQLPEMPSVPAALTSVEESAAPEVTLKGRLGRADFAPSGHGNLKSINTKEMFDVRQQAEFFMALGQHDEAVRLLEGNIKSSADYNPLVFLDLLKIFHTLGRLAEFENYRQEFNTQFTGRIPPYADFLNDGNNLEAYEDICQQIVALWPSEYTVEFIEQCMVRLPEDDPEQGIDLEAFKDLLLLYGVLKRLDRDYDSNLAPFSTSRGESSQPASVNAALGGAATAPLPVGASSNYDAAPTSMDIDLDLDLGGSEPAPEPPPAEPQGNLIDFDVSAYLDLKKPDNSSNPG